MATRPSGADCAPADRASRDLPAAKPARAEYVRRLPHLQKAGKTYFITFATRLRWQLPPPARDLALQWCLHDHNRKLVVHGAVVMPDHVHLVCTPLADAAGEAYGLAEIMQAIKSASAHAINKLLARRGPVWEAESFDWMLRSNEGTRQKAEYICQNPVRRGLAESEDQYPWLWREWIEGNAGDG
jgi:REP element-mobilizing transposase RayT